MGDRLLGNGISQKTVGGDARSQRLYRNLVVHEECTGMLHTMQKEAIQQKIDKQIKLGPDGLLEEDQYLAEINLGDLRKIWDKSLKWYSTAALSGIYVGLNCFLK